MPILHRSRFNPARGGHAPGDIREAFLEAIDAFLEQEEGDPEPKVDLRGQEMPISIVFGLLWNCSDILPSDAVSSLEGMGIDLPLGCTYAAAAQRLKPLVVPG